MEKAELEKLGAAALADIVYSELGALNSLIEEQQEAIDKINCKTTRDLGAYFCETSRMSGYTVARDMLLSFIRDKK